MGKFRKGRAGISTRAVRKVRADAAARGPAPTVFQRAEALGYRSPFPTPGEAQAYLDAAAAGHGQTPAAAGKHVFEFAPRSEFHGGEFTDKGPGHGVNEYVGYHVPTTQRVTQSLAVDAKRHTLAKALTYADNRRKALAKRYAGAHGARLGGPGRWVTINGVHIFLGEA